jgi:tetratricopeptide (TPR) repeat protein
MKTVLTLIALGTLLALGLTGCQSTYITSAKIYLQQNDLDNAREQLELSLKQNPNDAQAHFLLGKIHAQRKMYPEMLSEFDASLASSDKYKEEISAVEAKHFNALYNSAIERFNGGQVEKAIEELQIAMMIEPEDQEGWALLGKSYIRTNQSEEATAALEKAVALDPKFEKIDDRILLMEVYYNQDQFQDALNSAMEVIRREPSNKDAIRVAAFCYNAMGQTDKALKYYQEVLKEGSDDPDLIFNLGLLYVKMGNYEDAIAQFQRAFELNPSDEEAILHCAQIYLEFTEDYMAAVDCYRKALEIDPNNAGIMNNLGIALIRAGNELNDQSLIDEGGELMKKVMEMKGQNP